MASGLLSLKWNNHRSTFFHILSTIRSKESYCDVTIACDGKFYPVHKLVLSTCSDYFEQMFERTNCKHPIIVLKDIRNQELEALLNYMYVGEVNVLQNELAGLIKAAECLMIKGLAVPDEAPSKDIKENKRSYISREDSPVSKRRKKDEEPRPPPSNQHLHREPREHQTQRQSSSASSIPTPPPASSRVAPPPASSRVAPLPASSRVAPPPASSRAAPPPTSSRVAPPPISPAPSAGSASESVSEECSQPQSEGNEPPLPTTLPNAQESLPRTSEPTSSQSSQQSVPEVILDEPGVKEEPQELEDEELEDTKEIFEAHHFEDMGDGDSQSNQGASFDPQLLASQPQSMEDLVAQAIPGSSGMQGNSVSLWEGDGSFPMEGFTGDGTRQPQMACGEGAALTCPYCHRSTFKQTSDLRRHIRIHTGEKPFSCNLCEYSGVRREHLNDHLWRKHKITASKRTHSYVNFALHPPQGRYENQSNPDLEKNPSELSRRHYDYQTNTH